MTLDLVLRLQRLDEGAGERIALLLLEVIGDRHLHVLERGASHLPLVLHVEGRDLGLGRLHELVLDLLRNQLGLGEGSGIELLLDEPLHDQAVEDLLPRLVQCEAGFEERRIGCVQMTLTKPGWRPGR